MSLTRTTLVGPYAYVGLPGEVHTTQGNVVGLEADDHQGFRYKYLAGCASTVANSVVTFDEVGATTLIAANAIGDVAIATAATVASTWGWYLIIGYRNASCDAGIVDNAKVYIDGTAGRVDDTVVSGDQLVGACFRSTDTSNVCTLQVNRASVNDSLG